MICIYSQNNTDYTKNGDAVLIPTRCEVSMTINGVWQLTMEHPYDPEERYKYIVEGAVVRCDIKCIRELPTVQQRFRIYTYTKGLTGITAIGFPVAMESTYDAPIDNLVISSKTGAQAMAALQAFTNKYTLSTDVTKTASMSLANTNVNSAIASGSDNCFISLWGGEILYSNYDYMVKNRLGDNTAADHRIIYGRNLTNIEYKMDDSGLTTRIYPISKDGIRLNGTGYVDSPIASDYPVIHHRFMTAPYTLVDTNASSASSTAQKTRQALAAVSSQATTLSQAVDRTGYPPEYIKQNRNDIVSAVQTMALTGVISTSLYNALSKTIADAMAWMNDLAQPEWDWMGSYEEGWKYGNADGYAVNQYIKIGKKWCYFGADGNWQEPADSTNDWSWYQSTEEAGKRYGDFSRYYAHNEYVFITLDGQLKQYWFDKEGWYDEDKSGDSSYAWNGSGTAEDPWWFGESSSKYLKSCWAFIDGTYYFFDEFGYYDGSTKFTNWQWDWVDDGANPWFGKPDKTFAAIYLTNQWCKIEGDWYYFDQDGYAYDTNAARTDVINLYTTGMAGLTTTVNTWSGELYTLLYSLMTSFAENKFAQGVDKPVITITVNMADLSKTTEYAGYENLETVKLGDSVECIDNEHNISTTNRVVGITYDVLRDYNAEITIGNATASVASIVGNAGGEAVAGGFDTSAIEAQINALQNKVGDIYMNDASIVSNGVGRFAIQPGTNISISRSGNTLTINSTGADGDVNLYHGIDIPANSLGDDNDIYLQMESTVGNLLSFDASNSGTSITNYSATETNRKWDITATFVDNWEYHSFNIYSLQNLTVGKKYAISFDFQNDGTPPLYGIGELFGLTLQHTNRFIDMRKWSSDLVENGEFKYFADSYYGEWWYQSFPNDTKRVHYEFEFTARQITEYIGFYGDRTSGNLTCSLYELCVGDREETNEIKDVFYKINGEWLLYDGGETYEAGDNITIVDGVISATDTDEIVELEDVSLTDLADGEILKYNATTQKWENAEDSGGSEVEANPSGTATNTLTKLGIDGIIYEIQGGGGGGSNLIVDAQIYSLEEKQVGAWVDGKPLYQKTWIQLNAVIPYDTWTNLLAYANVEKMVSWEALDEKGKNLNGIGIIFQYYNGYVQGAYTQSHDIRKIDTFTMWYTKTTDAVGSGGFQAYGFSPIIYSTEEREVGVWIDNKPLYQKTILAQTSTTSNSIEVLHNISNLGEVVHHETNFRFKTNDYDQRRFIPQFYSDMSSTNSATLYYVDSTKMYLYYGDWLKSMTSGAQTLKITLWYTKDSDTAGSGSYTTLGVPVVHYTTDEQVIGTYLGETLYRKVFDFSNNPITVPTDTWLKVVDGLQVQPIRGTVIIPTSKASFDVATDCDSDGLYIRGWLGYSNVTRLIVEYTKIS